MDKQPNSVEVPRLLAEMNALLSKVESIFENGKQEDWINILIVSLEFRTAYFALQNAADLHKKTEERVTSYLKSRPGARKLLSKKSRKDISQQVFSIKIAPRAYYHFTPRPRKYYVDWDGVLAIELTSKKKKACSFFFYDEKFKTFFFVRSHVIQRLNERLFDRALTTSQTEAYFFHHIIRSPNTKIGVDSGYECNFVFDDGSLLGNGFSFVFNGENPTAKLTRVKDLRSLPEDLDSTNFNMVSIATFISSSMYYPTQRARADKILQTQNGFIDLGDLENAA